MWLSCILTILLLILIFFRLQDNPICLNESQGNLIRFCGPKNIDNFPGRSSNPIGGCLAQVCPKDGFYEYDPSYNVTCFCAAPLRLGYRLKSPSFSDFRPYMEAFEIELSHNLGLIPYQLFIDSYIWEEGPRLRMNLKLFPNLTSQFNISEVRRIRDTMATWQIHNKYLFGPYELLNFTLLGPYSKCKFYNSNMQKNVVDHQNWLTYDIVEVNYINMDN